jgi:hypothetical protein
MIDFPASPTDGQIFSATNGVVYKYSAAYGSWLSQNPTPPIGGTGDFAAAGTPAISGTAAPMIMPVINGNSGGYYNAATGRWTPPAGRYNLYAVVGVFNSSTSVGITGSLRKNGTAIFTLSVTASAANVWANLPLETQVDANGSDYFEFWALSGPATASQGYFGGFPLTGVQGPTGGAPGPVVGDFFVQGTGAVWAPPSVATWATAKPATVLSGNSGAYYNTTTGVYTPPAGRYRLFAELSFYSSASNMLGQLRWRKNGVAIPNTDTTTNTPGANLWGQVTAEVIVDANGTDTFDLQVQSSVLMSGAYGYMGAFPTQGMVGPQGPPGVISNGERLISRVVPTAGQTTVDFTNLPSDINDLRFSFDVTPSTNSRDFGVQFYDGSGTLMTATYASANEVNSHAQTLASAPAVAGSAAVGLASMIYFDYPVANRIIGSVSGVRGDGVVYNIRDATRLKAVNFQVNYVSDDASVFLTIAGGGYRNTAMAITGLRFLWNPSGAFTAGGSISLWGSP